MSNDGRVERTCTGCDRTLHFGAEYLPLLEAGKLVCRHCGAKVNGKRGTPKSALETFVSPKG